MVVAFEFGSVCRLETDATLILAAERAHGELWVERDAGMGSHVGDDALRELVDVDRLLGRAEGSLELGGVEVR